MNPFKAESLMVLYECNGSINQYKNIYPDIKIIVTGGDKLFFNHRFQHEIISIPHLVIVVCP